MIQRVLFLSLLLCSGVAFAQEAAPAPPPPADEAPTAVPADQKKEKKEKDHDLQFGGRVRMGAGLDSRKLRVGGVETTERGLELQLVEARAGLEYQALGWLDVQLEADFAGKPKLKDAFVRVESECTPVRGQFGQFKMPVSALTLDSTWKLPLPERGIIQGILSDHVQMLGRRQGAIGRVRAPGKLKPELTLGAFQGWVGNANDLIEPDLNTTKTFDSQNLIARAGLHVAGIEIGAVGERISTLVAMEIRHFWAAGLDATGDYELPHGGVRFWLEGYTGKTWHAQNGGAEHPSTQFGTARGVFAWRFGGVHKEQAYLEPFAMGGVFDPDLETRTDLVWEAMLGVNAGAWKRFRVGLTGMVGGSGPGVPDQLFVDNAIRKRLTLELQVGAAF